MDKLSTSISNLLSEHIAKQLVDTLGKDACEELIDTLTPEETCEHTNAKNHCKYIITRGVKKGMQCTTKVSGNENYCSKHKKTVNKDTKTKKKNTLKTTTPKEEELEVVEEELVITKDDKGRYREPKSGFVFKDEITISGKIDSDGFMVPLDKKDLVIVNMHQWNYVPTICT